MAKNIKKAKPKKPREENYEAKLSLNATFEEVFQVVKKHKEEKKKNIS